MKQYQQLKDLVASMEEDLHKFGDKGNSSAGMRLRKILQDIKKAAQEMRFEIQEIKKQNKGK